MKNSKQVWSFINEENDKELFENALEKTFNTGMILKTDISNVFIFNSKFRNPHEFEIVKEQIVLNENLVKNLTKLILKQLELSSKIPTLNGLEKGKYKEKHKGFVESIIHSLVCYKWELNIENISILDMAADIMYRIATLDHPFDNGNKRTALLSCGAFLYSTGLYLYFYKNNTKTNYLDKWETFMMEVANFKENGLSEEQALEKIKKEIKANLLINFNNRIWLYNKENLISYKGR